VIRCDNKAALSLRKEGQRVQHIDVIHHVARDHVLSGELSFVYCRSDEKVGSCLTKALSIPLFKNGLKGLGMISA
jgi:predicted N-acetyltransferase YhbS